MTLPFSVEQFFAVIRAYNEAVWPSQVGLTTLALVAVACLFIERDWNGVVIAAVLAVLWAWIAIAYHLAFFAAINPAAYLFAAISLAGAALFALCGVVQRRLRFRARRGWRTVTGFLLIGYALVVYPVWSVAAGHSYPNLPTFGLPCPTTIFTLGMLAFAGGPRLWPIFIAPVLWSLVGGQAAFLLHMPPDWGLFVAGVIGVVLALRPSAQQ
jgi:hypothetical protein